MRDTRQQSTATSWTWRFIDYAALTIGVIAGLMAFALLFVAAPAYEPIFLRVVALDAIGCLAALHLLRRRRYVGMAIVVLGFVAFTLMDVGFRYYAGVRLLYLL